MKYLLLSLALVACSPSWTYVQSTGANTARSIAVCVPDPVLAAAVAPALAVWRRAVEGWRPLTLGCPGDILVEITGPEACDAGALACADRLGGARVALVRGRFEGDPAGILAHELGHAFGAQHTAGLMSATYWRGQLCPDYAAILQVAAYQHGAPPSRINVGRSPEPNVTFRELLD